MNGGGCWGFLDRLEQGGLARWTPLPTARSSPASTKTALEATVRHGNGMGRKSG
jgi:hypothetical protein